MKRRYVLQQAIILTFKSSPQELFNYKKISKRLDIVNPIDKLRVVDILYDLADENFIIEVKCGRYRYNNKGIVLSGTFVCCRSGNNYFKPDDNTSPIAIGIQHSRHALNGDLVQVKLLSKRTGPSPEAEVIEILHRKEQKLTGRLQIKNCDAFLITTSKSFSNDVYIPLDKLNGAQDGDKVFVCITSWPDDEKNPSGEVLDILGTAGQHQAEMKALLLDHGLPYRYPPHIEKAAARIPEKISDDEIIRRRDFRHIRTFTIDPQDAKDFDDAISARRLDNGNWEVGVHIADVTYYVKPKSVIDREAEERVMSVYLVDHTAPMLPERLCNQICSLRPDEDKLCLSVVFELDKEARICHSHICETVIRSDFRFTYEEVQQTIETGKGKCKKEIMALHGFAKILREQRFKNGAVNFGRGAVKFETDQEGRPLRIFMQESKDANKLIEEFMLLANRTVTEFVTHLSDGKKKKPFIYRTHQPPGKEKINKFIDLIHLLNPAIGKKKFIGNLNLLLANITDGPAGKLMGVLGIRLMNKAKYSTYNIGHYGLAFDYYTHFTSPIRRYPDMLVHRLLKHYLAGETNVRQSKYEKICQHCSAKEVVIAKAERESIRYKQLEYMKGKEGQLFSGIIYSVAEWGLYVELDEIKCEGMVPVRSLGNEFFNLGRNAFSLTGNRTKRCYCLGDSVTVRVERVDWEQKEIYFALITTN